LQRIFYHKPSRMTELLENAKLPPITISPTQQ